MSRTILALVVILLPLLAGTGFAVLVGLLMELVEQPLTGEQLFASGAVVAAIWSAISLLWAKQHWRRV